MIKEITDTNVIMECPQCGKTFQTMPSYAADGTIINPKTLLADEFLGAFMRSSLEQQICDECVVANQSKVKEEEIRQKLQYRVSNADMLLTEAGIPPNLRGLAKPPKRDIANFIWKNRHRNILLGGISGSGKTTSACACLERMLIHDGIPVKYLNLSTLSMKLNAVSRFGSKETPIAFLDKLSDYDVICIDEVFGKTRWNDMVCELLFTLIDSATSGDYNFHLWLLGNIHFQSIQNMFEDDEAVIRRLEEFFVCSTIHDDGSLRALDFNALKSTNNSSPFN